MLKFDFPAFPESVTYQTRSDDSFHNHQHISNRNANHVIDTMARYGYSIKLDQLSFLAGRYKQSIGPHEDGNAGLVSSKTIAIIHPPARRSLDFFVEGRWEYINKPSIVVFNHNRDHALVNSTDNVYRWCAMTLRSIRPIKDFKHAASRPS